MKLETIAVFYARDSRVCAWACSDGVVATLSKMGFGVIDCERSKTVSLEMLRFADLIILCGPEHFAGEIRKKYGNAWNDLPGVKVIWFTETAKRDDRIYDFANIGRLADRCYFPAVQDAETFGGRWLPFGVDTDIFYPAPAETLHDACFIGNLYPKRKEFLAKLDYPLQQVRAPEHRHARRAFEHLAQAYRATKILVNLPSLSQVLVTKITEAMACRTMVITPVLDDPSAIRNMDQFQDGRHLIYYDAKNPKGLGEVIRYYITHPTEAEAIAEAGSAEINRSHGLEFRLRKILADVQFEPRNFFWEKGQRKELGVPTKSCSYFLKTKWDTIVHYDLEFKTLRHSKGNKAPKNLIFSLENLRGRLMIEGSAGGRQIRFSREPGDRDDPGKTSGRIQFHASPSSVDCDIEYLTSDKIFIRHENNYLSADRDGLVRNDRCWSADWEQFQLCATSEADRC